MTISPPHHHIDSLPQCWTHQGCSQRFPLRVLCPHVTFGLTCGLVLTYPDIFEKDCVHSTCLFITPPKGNCSKMASHTVLSICITFSKSITTELGDQPTSPCGIAVCSETILCGREPKRTNRLLLRSATVLICVIIVRMKSYCKATDRSWNKNEKLYWQRLPHPEVCKNEKRNRFATLAPFYKSHRSAGSYQCYCIHCVASTGE